MTTTTADTKLLSRIEAKAGNNHTANDVQDACTAIAAEMGQMFIGIDENYLVEKLVRRYWNTRA